mgnify:FL=1
MNILSIIFLVIIAYILGSIPNALWIGKVFRGIDIREHGSKNTGSTNAARVLGGKLGILTLILDVSKGAIPLILAIFLEKDLIKNSINSNTILILIGIWSIIGHSFSIFLNLKGGKAVATTLGVFIVLVPKSILVVAVVFFIVFYMFKYVSLSSILSSVTLPISIFLLEKNIAYTLFALLISILIILKHKDNIKRLLNGTETKFKIKNKK